MDQMRDDKVHSLCGRELRQGQHRLQQLAHVGGRQRRQDLDFQLVCQCGITRIHLRPHQFGLGDEPQRRRGESQVMLPGPIFLGLEFVPADLRLGILKGALGEVAAATPRDQTGLRGVRRGVEQRLRAVTLTMTPSHQPFGAGSLACGHGPNALHREVCGQPPAFRQAVWLK